MNPSREEIESRLDILRASLASVIEASRDVGLTEGQYKALLLYLKASVTTFQKHSRQKRGN